MNYLQILADYVASFDAEKKEELETAKEQAEEIAENIKGADFNSNIFEDAFMCTQYAGNNYCSREQADQYMKDCLLQSLSDDEIARKYIDFQRNEINGDDYMTFEELQEDISTYEPHEAFDLGCHRNEGFSWGDDYFFIDSYGWLSSISDSKLAETAQNDKDFIDWLFEEFKNNLTDYEALNLTLTRLTDHLTQAGY